MPRLWFCSDSQESVLYVWSETSDQHCHSVYLVDDLCSVIANSVLIDLF